MNWICKSFDELTPHELYAILQLRSIVFVVEQNCVYLDMDDKDQHSFHLMGWENEKLCAYTRIVPKGISYKDYTAIGRVVTAPHARGKGAGRELMLHSIAKTIELFGSNSIKIGAQLYLKKFYESLGFIQTSDTYLEDGIEHIEMILPLS
ncbi:MAG: GNAT family N-acetyltransferase [Bacteroidetes bacterium]|nr:MAG: GNAT family N-acetyltransferase [Bacteroidota bacterium]